jgi:hypothetical protein
MDKTEMMKLYEAKTGRDAVDLITEYPFDEYTRWLEAKAEAYDRLISGGKKTLKELANILSKPVAIDAKNRLWWFPKKPENGLTTWLWYDDQFGCFGEELPNELINYTGPWEDSLTLPDGWEEK